MTEITERTYNFHTVSACNMCGEDAGGAKVLGLRLDQSQSLNPRGKQGIAVTVCRCRKCGLIFTSPQARPRSISDHYGLPPEEYWGTANFDIPAGYFEGEIKTAKRLLDFKPGMKAIDVGLGLGQTARVLGQHGFEVHGFEPSEPFFAKATELLGSTDRFQLASIEQAEFASDEFDFVTFGAVLEHLYDPSAALAKAVRWLRPGGIIHAEIPNADHLVSRLVNAFYRVSGAGVVTNTSPMHAPFHLFEFTPECFRRNGVRLGYSLVETHVEVASIYHVPRVFHPLLRSIMARTDTGMQLFVWLRKDVQP